MLHIVNQLKFTRAEFHKAFSGVSEEEGGRRFLPINSIGWMVAHLAWHEQYYWLQRAQGITPFPQLDELAAFGAPASQPSLKEMIHCWEQVAGQVDLFLENWEKKDLLVNLVVNGRELPFNQGTMLTRVIYHYWYHIGEMQAVRQLLGQKDLPSFVGDDIETTGAFYLD